MDVLGYFGTLVPDVPEQVIKVSTVACVHPALLAQSSVLRSWLNSWWKCRRSFPVRRCSGLWSRTSTIQFLIVQGESLIFKVFFPDRVQQLCRNAFLSGCWNRRSIAFLVEVLKVFAQDKVHLRLRTVQLESLKTQMSLVMGFFALFPVGKKCGGCRAGQCGPAPARQLMDPGGSCAAQGFYEEEKEKEKKRFAVHDESAAVMERVRLLLEQAGKRRKRKKRKKRRLPRTSSHSSRSRARLRPRQWHAPGWFCTVHAVFPSFFDRPKMLGFLVGMDQKDRYAAWLRSCSSPTSTVALSWLVLLVPCCVSLRCPQAQDARHLVQYGPEGQFYSEIYLAVTCSACLAGGILELDFLGGDFDDVSVFSAMLGSTADSCSHAVACALLVLLVRIQFALCSLWLSPGPRCRHLGRY